VYFNRFYGSGYSDNPKELEKVYDPRAKVWAEYICTVCDHVEDMDVSHTWRTTFQTRERVCPKCGCMSPEDKVKNLEAELAGLTAEKSRLQIKIDRLVREIEEEKKEEKSNG